MQLEGMFDVAPTAGSQMSWDVSLPIGEKPWNVGLIVGPSGCGKSTIARQFFDVHVGHTWDAAKCLVDSFPQDMTIQKITHALSSVGLSSPPCWLRPFHVLSNGEQFRASLARCLCETQGVVCVDEFTSVVDRTVARVASAAVAKYVRNHDRQFVGVSCHYDIIEWLCPDWTYDPSTNIFQWRSLRRRPAVELSVFRTDPKAWNIFKKHHYLDTTLASAAACFICLVEGRPAAFTAVLAFPHPIRPGWREHRTVCLPDFQGVGIGNAMSNYVASLYASTGKPYRSTTSHPAMIRHRQASPLWKMTSKPKQRSSGCNTSMALVRTAATQRTPASFEYTGTMNQRDAAEFGIIDWIAG